MSSEKIIAPKKLIEVALPLDDINKAAAREKTLRHGHPSTLHLWWARRPLAAARAVIFAQSVNDPSWKYTPEELQKPQIRAAITRKRNELFRLLSQLVTWENTNNEELLSKARAEIASSWRDTCQANLSHPDAKTLFDPEAIPAFHDPFAGGGAIPLEAQRLGFEAHATDLNPVAVVINKAALQIPPLFAGRPPIGPTDPQDTQTVATSTDRWNGAAGLAEDVRRYGTWLRNEAERRIGRLYPKVKITREMAEGRKDLKPYEGQELTVIAWIWARTVKSPNPAFSTVSVPLAATFILSTKPDKEAWIHADIDKDGYRFVVKTGKPMGAQTKLGSKLSRGANFRCLMSESPISPNYIKEEGRAGRMGTRLMAVVAEGDRGRVYLDPTAEIAAIAESAKPAWKPQTPLPDDPRNFWTVQYGLTTYADLFTPRQLVALTTLSDTVQEVRERVRRDCVAAGMSDDGRSLDDGGCGATAYGDAIAVYLTLAIGKFADNASSVCTWHNGAAHQKIRATYSRQALPMTWDFAEGNPFSTSSGNFFRQVELLSEVIALALPAQRAGYAMQADAASQTLSSGKLVSTDPPYYDNIAYADLSEFFYIWLRRSLKPVFPDLFATLGVPKAEELVATPYRHGGKEEADAFFLDGMTRAMSQIATQAHPSMPVTIYYAFKQSETETSGTGGTGSTGWETFLEAVLRAGFAVTGTWPMRTELANRMIGSGTNALASSIILVCRPRVVAGTVARKDFLRELTRTLPAAITEMTADPIAAIAPVDLSQACIGPGMALFSRHEAVLEADGAPMTVHSALVHINKAIDEYFGEAEAELDSDTRFCITWFQLHGFEAGPFGDADNVARAKGTSVEGVKAAGVAESGKSKVRLFRINELPKGWDPTKDTRVPVWEACHHMCRALEESEGDAGALLARMPERQEPIRLLAYRLYTLCERKGWADQARAYNNLITSWPAIVEASQAAGVRGTQMDLI